METVECIARAWGWTGIEPAEVVGENEFGNLMVRDRQGRYWRVCPEDLYCRLVAGNRAELDAMSKDQEFLADWYMTELVAAARDRVGPLEPGYKYSLKMPGALGGKYGGENLAKITLHGLIEASGHIAQQIEGLRGGTRVEMRVTE